MVQFSKILLLALLSLLLTSAYGKKKPQNGQPVVTYDGRSLIINGSRELLFSGSIHYTRSPHEVLISC